MQIKFSGTSESIAYFLGGALILYLAIQYGIQLLVDQLGIRPLVGWWLTSGILFVAFFLIAVSIAHRNSPGQIRTALNLRSLDKTDALWAVVGLLMAFVMTGVFVRGFESAFSINLFSQDSYPSVLRMQRFRADEYWLFAAWSPFFFFNIFGEELLWRGYLLPRQAISLRSHAWILNGLLWAIFHVAIGWRLALALLPLEFIVPYIVQKRRNTWLGIIVHGLYNGTGFLMVAFGAVS